MINKRAVKENVPSCLVAKPTYRAPTTLGPKYHRKYRGKYRKNYFKYRKM
jgi:hypothetical protein